MAFQRRKSLAIWLKYKRTRIKIECKDMTVLLQDHEGT